MSEHIASVGKIIEALRICGAHNGCDGCPYSGKYAFNDCAYVLNLDASNALVDLVGELSRIVPVMVDVKVASHLIQFDPPDMGLLKTEIARRATLNLAHELCTNKCLYSVHTTPLLEEPGENHRFIIMVMPPKEDAECNRRADNG